MCLRPADANPYYWQYKGQLTILLGGSVEDNLFQVPDLEAQLDLLKNSGGNYIRNTLSSRDPGNLWMFAQQQDGRYDLSKGNDAYYRRLEQLLAWCFARDIIVQYELWDRFDYAQKYWMDNPFRPANNVNYTQETSGLKNEYPDHPGSNKNPFFRSPPDQENNETILKFQQAHIDRVLAVSLPYPNVLYCMDNETGADPRWGAYWSSYVKDRAKAQGVIVQTTEMWDDWNLQGEQHRNTLDHPEVYSFVDTSQNNHQKGQQHWDNLLWVRAYLKDAPRPINHVKCYGADSGRFGDNRDGTERFWRSLLGGAASIRFHRPDSGLGIGDLAQAHIRSARMFAEAYELGASTPMPFGEHLSGVEPNEAFLSLNRGGKLAIYMPRGGEVQLTIASSTDISSLRWLDIEKSAWLTPETGGTAPTTIKAPDERPWLVLVEPKAP